MDKFVSSVFSLGIGIGVGFAIGILLAPKSGDKTRADIKDKFDDVYEIGKNKVSDIVTKSKEVTSDVIEKGKQSIENKKTKVSGN